MKSLRSPCRPDVSHAANKDCVEVPSPLDREGAQLDDTQLDDTQLDESPAEAREKPFQSQGGGETSDGP